MQSGGVPVAPIVWKRELTTGLSSRVEQPQDYTIYSGEWAIGRIYEARWMPRGTGPSAVGSRPLTATAPTLEAAKGELAMCWRKWLAWG